jgi:SNF2 family DNA or RNA helicase
MVDLKDKIRAKAKELDLFITKDLRVMIHRHGSQLYKAATIDQLYDWLCLDDFQFQTEPFNHQRSIFYATRHSEYYGLIMDMGTGKSKVILDTAAYLFNQGKIDGLLILAPNGVHSNWSNREIPVHLNCKHWVHTWFTKIKKTHDISELLNSINSLKILCVNIESLSTKTSKSLKVIKSFLDRFSVMTVVDESSKIKNPKARRTKSVLKIGSDSTYRRILTGTPIEQGALNLYTQLNFLSPKILNSMSYLEYRGEYAIMINPMILKDLSNIISYEKAEIVYKRHCKGLSFKEIFYGMNLSRRDYSNCITVLIKTPLFYVGAKNVDKLSKKLIGKTIRLKKENCLDLPEKLYEKVYVDMSPDQRRVYEEILEEGKAEFENKEMTVDNVLTEMIRCQQIIGGFFKPDKHKNTIPLFSDKKLPPKLETMLSMIEDISSDYKIIIWARFIDEIKLINEHLKKRFGEKSVVLYYGEVDTMQRTENLSSFQNDSKVRFFPGNQETGGMGINLTVACYSFYYSNTRSWEDRSQSEGRPHRIGQENKVTYIDLITPDSIDEVILASFEKKQDFDINVFKQYKANR